MRVISANLVHGICLFDAGFEIQVHWNKCKIMFSIRYSGIHVLV